MGASTEKSVNVKQTVEKRKNKAAKGVLIAAIVIACLAVLIFGGILGAGIYAGGLDTVFPNVSAGGVPLEGLTPEQAEKALADAGYNDKLERVLVSITFPDDETLTVTGLESGLSLTAEEVARAAFEHGRTTNVFRQGLSYLQSYMQQVDVLEGRLGSLDEEHLRAIVRERVEAFNAKASKDSYILTDTQLLITKGSSGRLADEEEVYGLLVDKLTEAARAYKTIEARYDVGNKGGDTIDLEAILSDVKVEPKNAYYDPDSRTIVPHVDGVSFDLEAARRALETAQTGETVAIDLIVTPPETTTEKLEQIYFADVIAQCTTHVSGTSNRRHNVRLAAEAVNGVVLNPGETFSFNGTVGQRTTERGYKPAGAYVGGEVVDEVGGGICQVSSMLYNNALYADLQIVSRRNHMFTVSYLPLGIDATINWGTIDFKFKNTSEYPIRIVTEYKEGHDLTVTFYGTKTSDKTIKVVYEVVKKTDPETIYREDASVAAGKTVVKQSGSAGYTVDTYKLVYDAEGNLLSRTYIDRSTYRPQNKIILVPVGYLSSGETESSAQTPPPAQEAGPTAPEAVTPAPEAPQETPAGETGGAE